ncbi:MAG: hypothetical protein ACLQPD_10925 [Desulfomonilaceae bacterium]
MKDDSLAELRDDPRYGWFSPRARLCSGGRILPIKCKAPMERFQQLADETPVWDEIELPYQS